MNCSIPVLVLKPVGALFISRSQFKVDCTHLCTRRRRCRGPLFDRSSAVITKVRFHRSAPALWLRDPAELRVVAPDPYPHIISRPIN